MPISAPESTTAATIAGRRAEGDDQQQAGEEDEAGAGQRHFAEAGLQARRHQHREDGEQDAPAAEDEADGVRRHHQHEGGEGEHGEEGVVVEEGADGGGERGRRGRGRWSGSASAVLRSGFGWWGRKTATATKPIAISVAVP